MIKTVVICDICNKSWSTSEGRYKLKLKKRDCDYCFDDRFEFKKWEKLDVCPSCARKMFEFINSETRDSK